MQSTWGSDLQTIASELETHQREHRVNDQYHQNILQVERNHVHYHGEEVALFQQALNQLKKVYAELLSLSTKRLTDLDTLYDFMTSANDELNWLNERENIELNRDWSDTSMDLGALNDEYKSFVSDFNARDRQMKSTLEKGENLLAQHPASKLVSSYLQGLQEQRSWLYQLIHCFEVHFKHLAEYQNYFNDIAEQKEWLVVRKELLESKYSDNDFNLDRGDILLRSMQNIREEFHQFSSVIDKLEKRSHSIVPLKERSQLFSNRNYVVQSLCTYKQENAIVLEKGETVQLMDVSGQTNWTIRGAKSNESSIPSVCLMIPPPNNEATELIEKLRLSLEKMVELWQAKQIRLRQNMIFATVRVVKEWSFEHFLALGYEQRTTIRRALNDDSDKVLYESDPNDPHLIRLKQEMIEVNRLLEEFEKRANNDGKLQLIYYFKLKARLFKPSQNISTLHNHNVIQPKEMTQLGITFFLATTN